MQFKDIVKDKSIRKLSCFFLQNLVSSLRIDFLFFSSNHLKEEENQSYSCCKYSKLKCISHIPDQPSDILQL